MLERDGERVGYKRKLIEVALPLDAISAASARGEVDPAWASVDLDLLRTHKPALVERFDVTELALFGSFARGVADEDSDIDVLVGFAGPATARSYFGVQFYIEDLLGRAVDVVTTKGLRPEMRPHIDREKVVV